LHNTTFQCHGHQSSNHHHNRQRCAEDQSHEPPPVEGEKETKQESEACLEESS
jgi:hypothetical protein